jgi:hypothetical protein
VAGLLDYLKIPSADIIGYSLGGGVAMQCAIRHPEKVRKVVSISARFRQDGLVKEGLDAFSKLTPEAFKGSPIEIEYKKLSPTPDKFADLVNHIKAMASRPFDFGADKLKATKAPMFFIHGDADGVRLDHISEMYRLKGGEVHGDMRARSESRLAIARYNTRHADEPQANDRPDNQRLSRCQAPEAVVNGNGFANLKGCPGWRPTKYTFRRER